MRVLVIRLSSIGDVVVTTPVSRALREALPDAYLAWVVEPKAAAVLEGNPYLDEVIVWERRRGPHLVVDLLRIGRVLRARRFDWAVDCQGLLRSALLARLSGARRVVGNRHAKERADLLYDIRVPRDPNDPSSRQRCLDLLRPLGVESRDRRMVIPVSDVERAAARRILERAGLPPGARYACLVPATTWPHKHWFEDRWSELANGIRARLGLTPVLMGAAADVPMTERIRAAAPASRNVAGATSLKEAAAVLEGAALTVAVDTALMHLSVAMGTPTVALVGASWWVGFQDYDRFVLLREPLPCSPCLHRPTCGGRIDCMRAIAPERALAAAEDLLASAGAPHAGRP